MSKLTGNFYFKKTIFGMVLMVEREYEYKYKEAWHTRTKIAKEYRKAKEIDIQKIKILVNE